jgi:hypothetical protein
MFIINHKIWYLKFISPRHELLVMPDGEFTIGVCDNNTQTIYLASNLRGHLLKKVLCHEIVHAMMFSYQVPLTYRQEEIVAGIIDTYGEKIINITDKILERL